MSPESWKDRCRHLKMGEPDTAAIEGFLALVEELKSRRYFAKWQGPQIYIEWARGAGEAVTDHGDTEDLRSALLALRKLLLNDDLASVNRICNLLHRYEDDRDRLEELKTSCRAIKAARRTSAESTGSVRSDGAVEITRERTRAEVLDDWFNTQLFHSDTGPSAPVPDARGSSLRDSEWQEALLRQNVLELVIDEFRFAVWLSEFILAEGAAGRTECPDPEPGGVL